MTLTFEDIWKRLNDSDESVEIEAKTAQQIGSSLLETISAFSNEPNRGGGYLLLGVRRVETSLFGDRQYEMVGLSDPDKIQGDLATTCRTSFNVSVRPSITVHTAKNEKTVILAFIPEAQPHEKPVYIIAKGLPKGGFRRIGSTDQHCTDDDLQVLYHNRKHHSFDETSITDCSLDDLDVAAITEYRRTRAESNPNAPELSYSDDDLMLSLFAASKVDGKLVPTIAGLLLFGKRMTIRRHFPMTRIDYIRIPGREWVRDPDRRFESVELLDPLMMSIPRAINTILDDIPTAFTLPAGSNRRKDVPLIPRTAYRDINRVETLVASQHLRHLRDLRLFEQKGRGSQTYYVPTERMLTPQKFKSDPVDKAQPAKLNPQDKAQPPEFNPQDKAQPWGLNRNLGGLPKQLADAVQSLGQRASPDELRDVVRQLCQWKPLTAEQLARYLGRHQVYLTQTHLAGMIRDGDLVYVHPDQPAHPQQAYRVPSTRGKK